MSPCVGSLCYSCNSGLGILARDFYRHGVFDEMFVVEHSRHPTQWDWYPADTPYCPIRKLDHNSRLLRDWVEKLDVLLCFETPFYWPIVDHAKSQGVKTVMMPMYECSLTRPPATFDEYWCPSMLDFDVFSGLRHGHPYPPFVPVPGVYGDSVCRLTPIPVKVKWRQRTEAKVFVHNAGHGGLKGRNGTRELVDALPMVKSPATFLIRSQSRDEWLEEELAKVSSRVDVHYGSGTIRQEDLYSEGDVFIFPEKFNGLSLPLQEARASGMLVMATDRYPINTWLPKEGLILPDDHKKNRIGPPYMEFDEAVIDPRDIAEKIDTWYGRDITAYSQSGKEWAETMSWDVLGPKYKTLLEGLK